MNVEKIAFVTDLRGGERHAYRTAAWLARKSGARLQLIHVVEQGGRCVRWAEEHLRQAARQETALRGLRVETLVLGGGDPYETLADLTERENAELIICAHSVEELHRHQAETVLPERLATACAAPLLVLLRDDAQAARYEMNELGPHRVLLPQELGEATGAPGKVVWSLSSERRPVSFHYFSPAASLSPREESARETGRGGRATIRLGNGPPGQEVVKKARALGADLVVVGTGTDAARSGSLSEEDLSWILRHAPCSVLAVEAPVRREVCAPARWGSEYYCG